MIWQQYMYFEYKYLKDAKCVNHREFIGAKLA